MNTAISDNILDLTARVVFHKMQEMQTLESIRGQNNMIDSLSDRAMSDLTVIVQLIDLAGLTSKVLAIINKNRPHEYSVAAEYFEILLKVCKKDLEKETNAGINTAATDLVMSKIIR